MDPAGGTPPLQDQPGGHTMKTIDLDAVIKFNDDTYTYEDSQPNAGIPQVTFAQDHFEGPQLEMFYKNIRGLDIYHTYSLGGWEAGNFHRAEFEGPRVDGPVAWMNQNDTVITAHKQVEREKIRVVPGDHVIIRGTEYEISQDRRGYVHLTPAAA
jgi:hypothetical protein